MKLRAAIALTISILACSCALAGETTAAQEWRSYVEPLAPIGEREVAQMTDPEDPQLRQELYRFLYSQISAGYLGLLHADPEHPDFWPSFNEAYNTFGPNPDNVYYMTPIDGNGVYKISGYRGTVRIVNFTIAGGTLMPRGTGQLGANYGDHDQNELHFKKDGSFEVVLSGTRPSGYKGDWWPLNAQATHILVRQISYDWLHELDARLAIERLDRPAIKPRPSAQQIEANLRQIPEWTETWTNLVFKWLKNYRANAPINGVHVHSLASQGGLSTQQYVEGLYEIAPDEALVYETEVPKKCRYWSLQIMDMLMISIDYMNRQTNLNGYNAKLDKDGKFRAVISAVDPGVPNWLDTAGYAKGGIIGRWTECSSGPTPTITRVKVADVRKYLPADTPEVTAEERDATIRLRRKGAQLRRRW